MHCTHCLQVCVNFQSLADIKHHFLQNIGFWLTLWNAGYRKILSPKRSWSSLGLIHRQANVWTIDRLCPESVLIWYSLPCVAVYEIVGVSELIYMFLIACGAEGLVACESRINLRIERYFNFNSLLSFQQVIRDDVEACSFSAVFFGWEFSITSVGNSRFIRRQSTIVTINLLY